MKILTITVLLWMLAQLQAFSQSPDNTPIPPLSGTVSTFIDEVSMGIEIAPTVERTFNLARAVVVVGIDGDAADSSFVIPGTRVTVNFIQDGDEIKVDRIFLRED